MSAGNWGTFEGDGSCLPQEPWVLLNPANLKTKSGQALSAWLAACWFAILWAPLSSPVSFKGTERTSLGATEPAGEAVLQSALRLSGPGFGGFTPNCLLQRLSSVLVGLAWPHWNL